MFGALLTVPSALGATLDGEVVKVGDGDTVTVLVGREQHRVRLQGIDAPERRQPYGNASGRALRALVAGKEVRVEYDKRDRYGRIVAVVWVCSPDTRCDAEPCPKTLDAGWAETQADTISSATRQAVRAKSLVHCATLGEGIEAIAMMAPSRKSGPSAGWHG